MLRRRRFFRALRHVRGWLDEDEAWALHEAARTQPAPARDITVVEVGTWLGRSTFALARGLQARGGGEVVAVDPHRGTRLHRTLGVDDTYEAFLASMRARRVADRIRPVRAASLQACAGFADRSVHVLFLDGSHLYDDVVADLDAWSRTLSDGATLALHDVRAEPGVDAAVAERLEPEASPFHDACVVGHLLLARYRPTRQAMDSASGSVTSARST